MTDQPSETPSGKDDFLEQASGDSEPGLVSEFIGFMREYRSWWLTPILIVFGLVAVLLVLSTTGVAPFLYTLW